MNALSNPCVRHIALDGADHFFRDLYADDVVEMSVEFLRALLPCGASLQEVAASSEARGVPIIIFVAQQGCEYCAALRKQVLFPMLRTGELADIAIIREVRLDDGFELIDFQGQPVAGREFAGRYGAFVTPTLIFVDAAGEEVAERIVGISNLEYYAYYLRQRIDAATSKIAAVR